MADFDSSTILFQLLPVKVSSICAESKLEYNEIKKNTLFFLSQVRGRMREPKPYNEATTLYLSRILMWYSPYFH